MYKKIKKQFQELEEQLSDPAVVNDIQKLQKISKQHADLKELVEMINQSEQIEKQIKQNQEMSESEDAEIAEMAMSELPNLEAQAADLQARIHTELNPANPFDKKNAIMEIRAGTGGDESALFAADLFRMYSRFAEKMEWKIEILNTSKIGIGGYKEIIFEVKGKDTYGWLKYEAGTHRVQRVPETEKQGRIHTSAATVAVLAEAEEIDLEIKPQDIKIDTFASSGPGGQSVNTTNSAVRITYLPTSMVVSCQDQKSQRQNKEKAMQVLRSRLLQKIEYDRKEKESKDRKSMVGSGDRSEKIRTYNFPQDRITDHRINQSWHSIDKIMDGDIQEIIEQLKNNDNQTSIN
ncbi:MAG: peptide chain release factor 1 [bacterium]